MTLTKPAGHEDVPELLPCPFCGLAVKLQTRSDDKLIVILCPDNSPCRGSGLGQFMLYVDRERAITAWNRRAKAPAEAPELAPDAFSQAVKKAGSQTAFARQHGISLAYVNEVLQGRREPGDKILRALGMELEAADALSRLSAPPAEAKPVAWSVKPLDWHGNDVDYFWAATILGKYEIRHDGDEPDEWSLSLSGQRLGYFEDENGAMKGAGERLQRAISSATHRPSRPRPKAAEAVPEGTHDYRALLTNALTAVRALDDYTAINEVEWDASGENEVPPLATFWRVKSGQALKALDELRPSMLAAAKGMVAP